MMSGGVAATPLPSTRINSPRNPSKAQRIPVGRCCNSSWSPSAAAAPPITTTAYGAGSSSRLRLRCNSSTEPGGPGESDGRTVLDAFFLGKALAEALNERIESTVGEFLSAIGTLQAEQQKQVQDFQEEVLERAKKAKEKAAREAMEVQRFIPKSYTPTNISTVAKGASSTSEVSATTDVTPIMSRPSNLSTQAGDTNADPINEDPLLGASDED